MSIKLLFFHFVTFSLLPSINGQCRNKDYYLNLDENALLSAAIRGNTIGTNPGCSISFGNSSSTCDIYVLAATIDRNGGRGFPRNVLNQPNGCVRAPDWPKKVKLCIYLRPEYNVPTSVVQSFRTDTGITNAVNMLRYAIQSGDCLLPTCSIRTPRPSATPSPSCRDQQYYLSLDTRALWWAASIEGEIGRAPYCRIEFGDTRAHACDIYVITASSEQNTQRWPRNVFDQSSGCIRAPDWPRKVKSCHYTRPEYNLDPALVGTFCTEGGRDNAVAVLGHAIQTDQCVFDVCRRGSISTPTPAPTPCRDQSYYSSLSDEDLWAQTTGGKNIGGGWAAVQYRLGSPGSIM